MKNKSFIYRSAIALMLYSSISSLAQQWDGLTFYSNQNSAVGYLLDTNSTVVKTWNFTGNTGYSTHMMPGGTLFRVVSNPGNVLTGGGITGRIQKVDYSGALLWDYVYSSSTYCLHHDHCPLPNGNVLVISYDVRTGTDISNAGGTSALSSVRSEKIMELQPVGANGAVVVWEWYLWDHLVQNVNSSKNNYQASIVDHPELMNVNYKMTNDWIHMNGIDYNPVLDQIALSSHNLNEWYIIDHSTTTAEAATHSGGNSGKGGDFLYRWGNPAAYGASGSAVLNVTHDAHWIPANCPNGGNLAGVNNRGVTAGGNKTTTDQAIVPRNNYNYTITAGAAFSPVTYSSRHTSTGYTSNMGSVQEFPNGNQLVCLATAGTIYEINSAGTTLWTKTTGGATSQSKRYSLCYINYPAPAQPGISVTNSILSTVPAASYQWYVNGNIINGATSQTFSPQQAGIYVVSTTDGTSCVNAYSSGFNYTLTSTPQQTLDVGISQTDLSAAFSIYPNPTDGKLTIRLKDTQTSGFDISIIDGTGKICLTAKNETELDLSALPSGLYVLNYRTEGGISVNKKITLTH